MTQRRLPATSPDQRIAERLARIEQRLSILERKPTVKCVNGWGVNAPPAPDGTIVFDVDSATFWAALNGVWEYFYL